MAYGTVDGSSNDVDGEGEAVGLTLDDAKADDEVTRFDWEVAIG